MSQASNARTPGSVAIPSVGMVAFYFFSTAQKVVCMEVFVAGPAPNHGVVIKIPAGVAMNITIHLPFNLRHWEPRT